MEICADVWKLSVKNDVSFYSIEFLDKLRHDWDILDSLWNP